MENKIKCTKCGSLVSKFCISRHEKSCDGDSDKFQGQSRTKATFENYLQADGTYKCPHCDKLFKKHGIGTHIWKVHGKGINFAPIPKGSSTGRIWNKGLTKETDPRLKQQGETYRSRGYIPINKGKKMPKEFGEKIALSMQKAIENNPESYSSKNVCGRAKRFKLIKNGKEIVLHSSWELTVSEYLDFKNIIWEREIPEKILYEYQGRTKRYFPDFYLPEYDKYIEVKGYIFDKEREDLKWQALGDRLIVFRWKEIEVIRKAQMSKQMVKLALL